ncbi:MAG: hypothetical protein LBU14_05570 [Candidatus Peribacteria bacterium]|jgi:hypothetical protein|nr:hypothetical protein [Candidatus Peribacteria bacterium]
MLFRTNGEYERMFNTMLKDSINQVYGIDFAKDNKKLESLENLVKKKSSDK